MMAVVQKRKVRWTISLLLVMLYFSGLPAEAQYGGGSGEPNDPYLIYTAEQMNAIGANADDWDKHFILMADIDLSNFDGKEDRPAFNIIAPDTDNTDWRFQGIPFTGFFKGNGHKISNFSYTSTGTNHIGLFGYVSNGGEIKNIGLIDPNIDAGTGGYVGSLVGYLSDGTITASYVQGGSVAGSGTEWYAGVGGLVGGNSGDITHCYSTAVVSGDSHIGGLVGHNYGGSVLNSYSTGLVSGLESVGGLVGCNERRTASNHFSLILYVFAGEISNCYSNGSVTGNRNVGGLVGRNGTSYPEPDFSVTTLDTISNRYSTAHVTGNSSVGGLGDYNVSDFWSDTTITNCYSAGNVLGTTDTGGLVGSNDGDVYSSFWDIQTSGQETSAGSMGKTTAEMQMAGTFTDAGWDFVGESVNGTEDIWKISEGLDYPRLWWEKYGGGTGEPNDPYLIYTAEQMNAIGAEPNDWDKHFKLMADIDLSIFTGTDFNIIGRPNNPFRGVFDGNGKKISNFTYISTATNRIGLFRYVSGENTVIKDLGLIDANVDAGTGDRVGSLVGRLWGGTITKCYSTSNVTGGSSVGGLVGDNDGDVIHCYSISDVSGERSIGGLIGYNSGDVTYCYNTGVVSGTGANIGGLVGYNDGDVTNSYNTGAVSGSGGVGGLVGKNGAMSKPFFSVTTLDTIYNRYSTAHVTGNSSVDGLVGYSGYLQPAISISRNITGRIRNCYSTGSVSGTSSVGGLVGLHEAGPVSSSFWDIQTSGLTTSAGGTGKTTAEMQTASTFLEAGWDFVDETENGTEDIWWVLEGQGYPRLVWELWAFSPDPHNSAIVVIQPLILSWVVGGSALHHDIYFGEDEEAVANATTSSLGIYRGQWPAEITTYDPGPLECDKTYYWRIDEYNTDGTISKGYVWSFTTIKTANFIVVDDFEDYNDYPPDEIFSTWIDGYLKGIDGYVDIETWIVHSGKQSMCFLYDNNFTYSEATMTLVYPRNWTENGVSILSLWFYGNPSNAAEWMYVSLNGYATVYHDNPDVAQIDEWTEWTIDLQEFAAQGVNLANVNTITIGFGDKNNLVAGGSGLVFFDDICLYRPLPLSAFSPDPQDGATDVIQSPILHWVPAEPTLQHDIYFGESKELVANATTESPGIYRGRQVAEMTTYDPGILEWGKTYYWRINEVSEADPNSLWKGDVWSFTTADFILIDDFEDYNDYEPYRIFDIWIDGWGITTNGSIVGYEDFIPVETTNAHSGSQSMPYFYDNNISYSEATMTLVWPRDWTEEGVSVLSLWFYGDTSNAAERMYVALNGSAVVYHDNPDAALIDEWTQWRIDLQEFASQGVNLAYVNTISIGFGWMSMEGGYGMVLFDDIRLYQPSVLEPTQ